MTQGEAVAAKERADDKAAVAAAAAVRPDADRVQPLLAGEADEADTESGARSDDRSPLVAARARSLNL